MKRNIHVRLFADRDVELWSLYVGGPRFLRLKPEDDSIEAVLGREVHLYLSPERMIELRDVLTREIEKVTG